VLADIPDLSGWDVYACGNPMMIQAARDEFRTRGGLSDDRFFADAFVPSGQSDTTIVETTLQAAG
jgi:NAD(P)H-flavin reductase